MDSMEEQYGFDGNFIGEVPDYLLCVVCHLVMRKPVQLMTCGHRFCYACFERVKGYSHNLNTDLCCPVDRGTIDVTKVFVDIAIARVIGQLQIMCSGSERGCTWKGDLQNNQSHEDECVYCKSSYDQATADDVKVDSSGLLMELHERILKCEDAVTEKEECVAYLKYNLQQLETSVNETEKEVDMLKNKNKDLEEEMAMIKEKNHELKKYFLMNLENLSIKHDLLQKAVESAECQLLQSKEQLEDQQVEMTSLNDEVKVIDDKVRKINDEMVDTSNQVRKAKDYLDKSLNDKSDEINKLSIQVTTIEKEIKNNFSSLSDKIDRQTETSDEKISIIKCDVKEAKKHLDESLSDKTVTINKLFVQVTTIEQEIKNNFIPLNDKADEINKLSEKVTIIEKEIKNNFSSLSARIDKESKQMTTDQKCENIDSLQQHILNVENLLFCKLPGRSNDILLQWKLQNYQYHFDIGKEVHSPIFFTQLNGYCFKFVVQWFGNDKEDLGFFLKLCQGRNYSKELQPFKMSFTLEMLDKNSEIFSRLVPSTYNEVNLEEKRQKCLTIPSGKNETELGWGYPKFLTMPDLKDYIVNDMLTIQCRLSPS